MSTSITVDPAPKVDTTYKTIHNNQPTKYNDLPKSVVAQAQFARATDALVSKMQRAGLPELMIQTFCHYYAQLVAGESGFIYDQEAQPTAQLPSFDSLTPEHEAVGQAALDQVVYLKLNGGLGTSMGMQGPKSLVTAKDGWTFLDIIVQQVLHLRAEYQARLPLLPNE